MIKKLLKDRYAVIKPLATGGFGETYIAKDTHLPKHPLVVIKRLKIDIDEPSQLKIALRLFDSEAQVLQKLGKHPQIPQLLAYFSENSEFYLLQELIQGHPLSHELTPGKKLSEQYVISLLHGILEPLAFVHKHNVIHRDIKPDNIIRRKKDGVLFLIDFGAVKEVTKTQLANPKTQTNLTVSIGTPGYMPSEQTQGRPKFSSDLYAIGMTAIQALTGVFPSDLKEDIQTGEFLWRDRTSVSDNLANFLDKMIRYDFRQRYPSAQEALQVLKEFSSPRVAVSVQKPGNINSSKETMIKQTLDQSLESCMTFQKKSSRSVSSQLAGELLELVNWDKKKAEGLIMSILFEYPNKSVEWCIEQAIADFYRRHPEARKKRKTPSSVAKKSTVLAPTVSVKPKTAPTQKNNQQNKPPKKTTKSGNPVGSFISFCLRGLFFVYLAVIGNILIGYMSGDGFEQSSNRINPVVDPEFYADQAYNQGDYRKAVEEYSKVINQNQASASTFHRRGYSLSQLGDNQGAIKDYTEAIRIAPTDSSVYFFRGLAFERLGDNQGAIKDYTEVIRLNPTDSSAYLNRGVLFSRLGDRIKALSDYEAAIKIKPDYSLAWSNKASALNNLGRYAEAIHSANQAININENWGNGNIADAYFRRAYARDELGDLQGAFQDYTTAISHDGNIASAYHNRGSILLKMGQKQQAIQDYQKAASLYMEQENIEDYQKLQLLINFLNQF